jgi:ABC-2 type transport system ATP-binding protein
LEESALTLIVERLTKRFGRFVAVDEVSFTVPPGSVTALLGHNGAGKSTLMQCLAGVLRPDAGRAEVDGVATDSVIARSSIGFVAAGLALPDLLTGQEYLALIERLRDQPSSVRERRELLATLRLRQAARRPISTYSLGMRRILEVAAAVQHQPTLLLLDEPFVGLDVQAAALVKDVIERISGAGGCVLLATHDLALAGSLADRSVVLAGGRVVDPARVSLGDYADFAKAADATPDIASMPSLGCTG